MKCLLNKKVVFNINKWYKKFIYGLVREGARAKEYETAIMWLSDCGLVLKCYNTDKAVIFASVATLGRDEYLKEDFFAPDYFDYMVIDDYAIIGLTRESPEIKAFAA